MPEVRPHAVFMPPELRYLLPLWGRPHHRALCRNDTPFCVNCRGGHSAAWKGCPAQKIRVKATKPQTSDMTFHTPPTSPTKPNSRRRRKRNRALNKQRGSPGRAPLADNRAQTRETADRHFTPPRVISRGCCTSPTKISDEKDTVEQGISPVVLDRKDRFTSTAR